MTHFFKNFLLTVLVLHGISCTQKNEKGSEKNPILVSLIPSKEATSLLMAGDSFKKYMEKETGYFFEMSVPSNYIAVVEALGSKRSDIAFLTTNSYALAYKKYNVEAQYITVGSSGKTTYRGQFLVKGDSKIKKLEDLNGKKIAYVDPSSSSGYVMPAALLKRKNIKPSQTIFAGKHDFAVTMLYQGRVDASATYYSPPEDGVMKDARRLVLTQYPDVEKKLRILDFTDELPNDALVFRKELDVVIKSKIQTALEKWVLTEDGIKTLKAINNGVALKKVTDDDYIQARKMLNDMEETLK